MSTTINAIAERAIDGNPDAVFNKLSCTHTYAEKNPWWSVTFKYLAIVKEVTILNRADCCGKWIYGFTVGSGGRAVERRTVNRGFNPTCRRFEI